jgi:ABC-2 type transport system ATP-binding protein
MNDNIIEIKNLTKKFKEFTLDNVNINLPQGAIMGFVGENGAGKTTTIKLILNQLKKDSGDIKVFGLDSVDDEIEIKENIGIVLSENHFHDDFSPKQVGKMMSKVYKRWNNKQFDNYLEIFGLTGKKKVKELSHGMRMKLAIATAISHDAKLLILDEATSGLDPVVRNEVLDIFYELIMDGQRSIFLSSHITSDLEKIADYITFIKGGKIVLSDTKDSIEEQYGIVHCKKEDLEKIDKKYIAGVRQGEFSTDILVNNKQDALKMDKNFVVDKANIEDIMTYTSL